MELSALAGNAHVKAVLSQQEGGRGLSHAYILSGPAGSGRHTLARLLCGAMLCAASGGERPCGRCAPCRKVFSGVHPDVAVISGPREGKPITVDQVRALRSDAYIRPNEGERKIYLLEQADRMNQSAQNAMLKLLEEDLPMDVVFVFTAQEEVGTRGAFGAAFSVAPETALVLETTTAADLPGEGHRRVCAPGRGPVISYMDGGTIYDRGLFEDLRRLAEDNGIPWQTKEYIAGGNDARTIQRSRAGVRVAALSAAVRYLHAPASVGSLADFEDMLALTRLFVADQAARL